MVKKIKTIVPWTYVIDDLIGEEIIGIFHEKELKRIDQQEFRIEKVIKKKGDKLYVKWKGCDNSFNSCIDKKDLVKVGLSNYATKTDLKNVSHIDVSSFVLKSNPASLETEVGKIDADKLKTVPVDLAKLSNVVKQISH